MNQDNKTKTIAPSHLKLDLCYIGIDPAFREKGFAMCIIDEDREADFTVFPSFLSFLDWLYESPDKCFVCIENSNLQDVTFDMRGKKSEVAKKSRNVGKNQAISQCTVDACVKHFGDGYVAGISPLEKGGKYENDILVQRVAKSENLLITKKRLNQDERDAFKLAVIGMRIHNSKLKRYGFK